MVPAAVAAMTAELSRVGNASSLHGSGRAARRVIEDAREAIAGCVGAKPAELIFTCGGTESDNLAVKGAYWSRAGAGRRGVVCSAVEHHAVLDSVDWLGAAAGAEVQYLPVDETGRIRTDALDAAIGPTTAVVSVMWANNEIGTLQPIPDVVAAAARHGAVTHSDAVQAVGHLEVDFAESGLDLLSFTAHKLGGPYGIGALLARREVNLTAILHGGGQERDVRSGTLDVAATAGFAAALAGRAVRPDRDGGSASGGCGPSWSAGSSARPRAVLNGPADPDRHPAGGCELHLRRLYRRFGVDAAGRCRDRLRDRLGLLGRAGPAESRRPRPRPQRARRAGHAAVLPGSELDRGRRRGADRRAARGGAARSRRRRVRGGGLMRVLAAMSGGVDSAVAAARAVDAGHDVTGVHLALSKNPQSYRSGARGCCSKEDAHDARRSADVLDIPFYVWDLSDRFAADVVDDFVAAYAAGQTPNPCLRCNEKIKFAAVLDRAVALGFDAVCTGHYARLIRRDTGVQLHRAYDEAKDQSYVLGVLTQAQLARAYFPLGESVKAEVRAEAQRRGLAVADKPDSHDICFIADGDTAGFLRGRLGETPGEIRDVDGAVVGRHTGAHQFTVGQRRGLRLGVPAADGRPRYVLDISPVDRTVTVGPYEALRITRIRGVRPIWTQAPPADGWAGSVQLRAHGQPVGARAQLDGDDAVDIVLEEAVAGIAPGQAAVLYEGSRVLGAATIAETAPVGASAPGWSP